MHTAVARARESTPTDTAPHWAKRGTMHGNLMLRSTICRSSEVEKHARRMVNRLQEVVKRQQFEISIQASLAGSSKVIAGAKVKAYRKDVTAKLYGGDRTRKMKLLEKQKKGKKAMKSIGKVQLDSKSFMAVVSPK